MLKHFESHTGVVAGLVPATPRFEAQRKNNRGGRDKPGHDGSSDRIPLSSSEDSVQKPAMRAGRPILAVAGAIDPEALAGIVFDLEIIAHRP